jgi:hypothetical protein
MKTKKVVLIFLALGMVPFVLVGNVVTLPDLVNPISIAAEGDRLYITEQTSVFIFSSKNFKLLKKFGKRGEGPSEFMTSPGFNITLYVHPDYLLINSPSKISIFSKEGKFIKEQKSSWPLPNFQPLGKSFVGFSAYVENKVRYLDFHLYDLELKKTKPIFKTRNPFQRLSDEHNPLIQTLPYQYYSKHGKVFINEVNEVIHVFGADGKKNFVLKYDFNKLKVTDKLKEEVYEVYRTHPGTKNMFETLKKLMKFPQTFPPMRDFYVADKKIYVLPFAKENGENYFYIFDMNGKFVKKIPVPIKDRNIFELYPYALEGSKLYQLVENEEEEWELHIASIEVK